MHLNVFYTNSISKKYYIILMIIYITIGPVDSNERTINKEIMTMTYGLLGTPLAQNKCEDPSSIKTFLGIKIYTTFID